MIHYQLQCDRAHSFDGWFKDSASFERQCAEGLITCPVCSSTAVSRALMAPALGRSARHATEPSSSPPATAPQPGPSAIVAGEPAGLALQGAVAGQAMRDQLRALLQRLRHEVESTCDYVGQDFAEEARRIHYGETEARGIYGETTASEAEALTEEGIAFGVLPWIPRSDS
ncbi:DUF1178 family protein [Acidisoma sp. 7E03]